MRFIRASYAEALGELLAEEGVCADIVYFDLGMSSMQVDTRERGFSYSYQAPLDMRMDPDQELTAREIVATWDERRLARTLRDFGEERHAGAIARAIVRRREQAPIETTLELVETINAAIPAPARFAGGHPAKRSFQALRIAVNDELEQLDDALPLRVGAAARGRRARRDLLPLARGPPRQALLGGPRAGCICPPDLPVCGCGRTARGRAAHAPRDRALRRRDRAQPALRLRAPARRPQAGGGRGRMTPPPRHGRRRRPAVHPRRAPLAPVPRPRRPRRVSGPARSRPAPAPARRAVRSRQPARRLVATHPLLDRLIPGRTWIGVVAFALIGIVTMQLGLLKLNAGIGRALEHEALLQRENATLSVENSEIAAGRTVELQATHMGMELIPRARRPLHSSSPRAARRP